MLPVPKRPRLKFRWGIPTSVGAHAIVLALLIFGLPQPHHKPDQTDAVNVDLVPPPPIKRPEIKKPEQAKTETPKKQKKEAQKQKDKPPMPAPKPAPEARKPDPASKADKQPPKVLRPVFEFAKKGTGPKKPADGNAAQEAKAAPPTPPDKPAEESKTQKLDANVPEMPAPAIIPVPEPAPKPPVRHTVSGLPGTRFHSRSTTDGPLSTTAMGTLPRGLRAGELCATALREELRNAMPPYWPDLLPAYRLDKGNVLQVSKGAFHAADRWYDLSFRCEVDPDATRVVSFDFDVGAPVPHGQWTARGLPAR